jgi:uncharacterized membrane protein
MCWRNRGKMRDFGARLRFGLNWGFGAAMAEQGEPFFETRRLEALSNTVFGVAMTLLAYDFPKEKLASAAPDWSSIAREYAPHLTALLLSFLVAGLFWFSHQRRLAYAPGVGRAEVLGNLLLLLSIILLPVTTGLYGAYPEAGDVVALYGFHLAAIALINLALWWMALAARRDWHLIGGPASVAVIFVLAAAAAPFAPHAARSMWTLGFIAPVVAALVERRARRRGA